MCACWWGGGGDDGINKQVCNGNGQYCTTHTLQWVGKKKNQNSTSAHHHNTEMVAYPPTTTTADTNQVLKYCHNIMGEIHALGWLMCTHVKSVILCCGRSLTSSIAPSSSPVNTDKRPSASVINSSAYERTTAPIHLLNTCHIVVPLTAFSGSPMNTLREGSSRNCLHLGQRFGG